MKGMLIDSPDVKLEYEASSYNAAAVTLRKGRVVVVQFTFKVIILLSIILIHLRGVIKLQSCTVREGE